MLQKARKGSWGVLAGFAIAGVVLPLLIASPSQASEFDIYDADGLVRALAPEVLASSAPDSEHVDVAGAETRSLGADAGGKAVRLKDVELEFEGEFATTPGIDISIDFAEDVIDETEDFSVLATSSDDVAAYVQPTNSGVRMLTAIADADAPTKYSYSFDVPDGTTLRPNSHGFYLTGPDGSVYGQVDPAWAVDAAGAAVDTWYEWEGKTLIQHVRFDKKSTAFPVLADPGWSYTHTYDLEHTNVPTARSRLMSCFNCYFPVEGAPAGFPSGGQFLPLVVRPWVDSPIVWNFNCYMNGTYYQNDGNNMAWFGYDFMATPSHVDGNGSAIYFDFQPKWTTSNPSHRFGLLVVTGWVMNDTPMGVSPGTYSNIVWWQWLKLAQNLNY